MKTKTEYHCLDWGRYYLSWSSPLNMQVETLPVQTFFFHHYMFLKWRSDIFAVHVDWKNSYSFIAVMYCSAVKMHIQNLRTQPKRMHCNVLRITATYSYLQSVKNGWTTTEISKYVNCCQTWRMCVMCVIGMRSCVICFHRSKWECATGSGRHSTSRRSNADWRLVGSQRRACCVWKSSHAFFDRQVLHLSAVCF